jgi:hypothetical protein
MQEKLSTNCLIIISISILLLLLVVHLTRSTPILPPWIFEIFLDLSYFWPKLRDIECERIKNKKTVGAAGWTLRF